MPAKKTATSKPRRKSVSPLKNTEAAPKQTNPPMINPAWVSETVRSFGLVGKTAKEVEARLATEMEARAAKTARKEAIIKIVMRALTKIIKAS